MARKERVWLAPLTSPRRRSSGDDRLAPAGSARGGAGPIPVRGRDGCGRQDRGERAARSGSEASWPVSWVDRGELRLGQHPVGGEEIKDVPCENEPGPACQLELGGGRKASRLAGMRGDYARSEPCSVHALRLLTASRTAIRDMRSSPRPMASHGRSPVPGCPLGRERPCSAPLHPLALLRSEDDPLVGDYSGAIFQHLAYSEPYRKSAAGVEQVLTGHIQLDAR